MPHDDRGMVKIEMLGHGHRRAGRHRNHLRETARAPDTHHTQRAVVAAAIFGADVERHDTRGGDAIAGAPAADLGADRIDDAGTVDARGKRQHRPAILLAPGAQADVQHAVHGRGMDPDADFALARHRVGYVLVAQHFRRAVFADDNGFHTRPSAM